jgi:CspA family cold shock protein
MNRKQLLAAIVLVTTVAVALVTGVSLLGRVRVVDVTLLFLTGVGAGVSVKILIGSIGRSASKVGLVKVKPTVAPQQESPRGRRRNGGQRQRSGRKKQPARTTGQVKWFDDTKGFGFITPDDGNRDCFVHRSAIKGGRSLPEGKRVEFHVVTDERGREAASDVVEI